MTRHEHGYNNWATGECMEVPWWHDDITPEDWDAERYYFRDHYQDYLHGTYVPMWKQNQKTTG